jgi:hypothetical protein
MAVRRSKPLSEVVNRRPSLDGSGDQATRTFCASSLFLRGRHRTRRAGPHRGAVNKTRIADPEHAADDLANHLLDNAAGAFVTLTKLYTDPKLHKPCSDTVIVDEASMAMPRSSPGPRPEHASESSSTATSSSFRRSRSREGSERAQLGRDLFELRDVPKRLDDDEVPEQLAQLAFNTVCIPRSPKLREPCATGPRTWSTLQRFASVNDRHGVMQSRPLPMNSVQTPCPWILCETTRRLSTSPTSPRFTAGGRELRGPRLPDERRRLAEALINGATIGFGLPVLVVVLSTAEQA